MSKFEENIMKTIIIMKYLYYKSILCKPHALFDKPIIFEEIRTGKYLIII